MQIKFLFVVFLGVAVAYPTADVALTVYSDVTADISTAEAAVIDIAEDITDETSTLLKELIAFLTDLIGALLDGFDKKLESTVDGITSGVAEIVDGISDGVGDTINKSGGSLEHTLGVVTSGVVDTVDHATDIVDSAAETVKSTVDVLADKLVETVGTVKEVPVVGNLAAPVLDVVKPLDTAVKAVSGTILPIVPNVTKSIDTAVANS